MFFKRDWKEIATSEIKMYVFIKIDWILTIFSQKTRKSLWKLLLKPPLAKFFSNWATKKTLNTLSRVLFSRDLLLLVEQNKTFSDSSSQVSKAALSLLFEFMILIFFFVQKHSGCLSFKLFNPLQISHGNNFFLMKAQPVTRDSALMLPLRFFCKKL